MRNLKKTILEAFHTYKQYKQQIIRLSALALAFLAGCLLSYPAGQRSAQQAAAPKPGPEPAETGSSSTAETLDGIPHFEFPSYASYSDATPSNVGLMSPDMLNLAYLYEDGVDTTQPSYSYAGRLYSQLSEMDAKWSSGIYDLCNYTPERLAALLGLPSGAVTTASGVIPEFKNVDMRFLNGDGQPCGSTSNARSIVAMANMLYYHGVLRDMEQMRAYVSDMWDLSHSYSAHMGDIYYCDGSCLEQKAEAVNASAGSPSDASKSASDDNAGSAPEPEEGGADTGSQEAAASQESSPDGNGPGEPRPGDGPAVGSGTGADAEPGAAFGAEDAKTESSAPTGAEDAKTESSDSSKADDIKAESVAVSRSVHAETGPDSAGPDLTAAPGVADAGAEAIAADGKGDFADGHKASADGQEASTDGHKASEDGQEAAPGACPGHIDFSVRIVIKGVDEANGLFRSDRLGAEAAGQAGWKGWDEASMESVRNLGGQDWYEQYNINTTDLFLRNPLTSAEIDIYMGLVPEDTSPQKKGFVRYALSSVGKIPYYWGGKPSSPGYTGNRFGSVTTPDEDGRFLKGLDCSGWINWVYWSSTGRGLGAESTATLLSSGRAVTKEHLVPGDICIRTGPAAHVVIFLGWAEDGRMLCIQETSGNINNVEVGLAASDWQSYRRILE